jgi:hypothetical protein
MTSMDVPDLESRYRVRPGELRLADRDAAAAAVRRLVDED